MFGIGLLINGIRKFWVPVFVVAHKLKEQFGKTALMAGAQLALQHIDESQKQPKAKCPFTTQCEMITSLWVSVDQLTPFKKTSYKNVLFQTDT